MGNYSYTDIYTDVKVACGNRTDIDTQIGSAINAAYQDISVTYHHFELEKTVTGSLTPGNNTYVLPADIRAILSVKDMTQGNKLDKADWRVFDQQVNIPQQYPTQYDRFGSYLIVNPAPLGADVIQLRYMIFAAKLIVGSVPLTNPEWDEGLILGAKWRALQNINEYDKAERAKADYVDYIKTRTDNRAIEDEDMDSPLGVRYK